MDLRRLLNGLHRTLEGAGFDARFVAGSTIDTGAQAERAMGIAARLNAVREGIDKQPVILWKLPDHAAVTARGRFIYVAMPLAQRLSDDALAFVLAHEMAHHDLGHVSTPFGALRGLASRPAAELDADLEACRVAAAAGFDPAGGLEALGRHLHDDDEPEARWFDRWRRSHPPTSERLAAIREWIATQS